MTDLDLLARIIKCEAGGEGEIGMKAVATVIMNRVRQNLGEYGLYNDIPNVIYAPGQFDCAREYIRGEYELPDGWFRLFLQMCEDIREPLKKAD